MNYVNLSSLVITLVSGVKTKTSFLFQNVTSGLYEHPASRRLGGEQAGPSRRERSARVAPSVPLPACSFTAITQGLTGKGWNLSSRAHLKRCLDVAQVILHRKSSQRPLPAAVMVENKAGIREDKFRVVLRERRMDVRAEP